MIIKVADSAGSGAGEAPNKRGFDLRKPKITVL